ncbi:MAG: DUF5908 family protein [Ilumatobacter sp.]|uniref:DUF5908 family protein n=1 Tax=Ilumatobacter sp. TaxID=1967498 RepID=UPI0026160FEF|nr:DUF5908 family protein [Ilumatobacter sp.]MDJ0768464.1 DUF5908 family protein [Ilumatobacter sp.]
MPIEIRELVIRARVGSDDAPAKEAAPTEDSRNEIVAECVEQVLDVLRRQQER